MINTLIKRNGHEEAFSAAKVNGWGEWASEHLGNLVDWSGVVANVVRDLKDRSSTQDLQLALIQECLDRKTWSYYRMAGRLYAAYLFKFIYDDNRPTVKALHTRLQFLGLMRTLKYSDDEYQQVEQMIDHDRDFYCPHFSLHHIRQKYAIKNRVTGEEYETQQFMYMRMAMVLAENEPADRRMNDVAKFYEHLSGKRLSAPTPNYMDLGVPRPGLASCCLFVTGDDGTSLAISDYIANIMTQANAGIGVNLVTRSVGDPVRGGSIRHLGKQTYIAAQGKSILANTKNGRGGAGTLYWNAYDPESEFLSQLRNPRQVEDKKNRDLNYNMMNNKWFAAKVAKNEEIMCWNVYTAPDLHKAFYGKDLDVFIETYKRYEADPKFKKKYVKARELLLISLNEAFETGVAFLSQLDEINRHTPFIEPIYSSNLCAEIMEPTAPYYRMMDLFNEGDNGFTVVELDTGVEATINHSEEWLDDGKKVTGWCVKEGDRTPYGRAVKIVHREVAGEIAMCSLAAIAVDNIENEKQYEEVCYYALKMIDYCILNMTYPLPHVAFTSRQRMNAGVGMMGLATHMARNHLSYASFAGKQEIHFLAERHMWYLNGASLRISKERGNAPWIHRTKWPEGWLPLDTYNKGVDAIGDFSNTYNWDRRRQEIIDNGGLAHSVLAAYMPGESSSKALGTANSLYPVRNLTVKKTDEQNTVYWAAPYGDDPAYKYEIAYDVPTRDLIDCYALIQKWTDQGISADLFRRIVGAEKVKSTEMIGDYLHMVQRGLKTRYYQNTLTTEGLGLDDVEAAIQNTTEEAGCASGACAL